MTTDRLVTLSVIAGYLLVIASVGLVFRAFSRDVSDFFRAGGRATWWLVGVSMFMQSFSALTFTGLSGQAYVAGWSVLVIFWCNALGFLLQAAVLAPWFRQTRAVTGADVIHARYGRLVEQVYVYLGLLATVLWSSIMLLGTATFIAAVFGFSVQATILTIGAVVACYAIASGSWGVLAADFLQGLILLPLTVAIALLCLAEVGGVTGLLAAIDARGLADDFALIKPAGHDYTTIAKVAAGSFTWGWVAGMAFNATMNAASLTQSYKYLAVKTGRDARRAALLGAGLMIAGSAVWFLPPMVARLLYEDQVRAVVGVGNLADAAYATAALQVLPAGLIGLLVVAMLGATMSTMDTGLTANAGALTRNAYPPLARRLGFQPLEDTALLRLGRLLVLALAAVIVSTAYLLSLRRETPGLFGMMMSLTALLGVPMTVPMTLGLFLRRFHATAVVASIAAGLAGSVALLLRIDVRWLGVDLVWQQELAVVAVLATAGFFAAVPAWRGVSQATRDAVDAFFAQMHRPVDFAAEVGPENDRTQLAIVGVYGLAIGTLLLLLLLVPADRHDRLVVLAVAVAIQTLSALMLLAAQRGRGRRAAAKPVPDLRAAPLANPTTNP
jgi:solute:Na+ symporter, SSS family